MELNINKSVLDGIISNLETANSNINPATTGANKPSICKGIVLDDYYDRLLKISQLLSAYKQLLEVDVKDIRESRLKLEEMDRKIGDIFKFVAEAEEKGDTTDSNTK